jgi:hypothetical protein
MAVAYKIVVDSSDPHRLAAFWAEALGYVMEDHSKLIQSLVDAGRVSDGDLTTVDGRPDFRVAAAVRDPDAPFNEFTGIGEGGRILFQSVPEPKTVKNRVHLDLHVGPDARAETVARLEELGAKVLYEKAEMGSSWVTMADPEGNEFCVA